MELPSRGHGTQMLYAESWGCEEYGEEGSVFSLGLKIGVSFYGGSGKLFTSKLL